MTSPAFPTHGKPKSPTNWPGNAAARRFLGNATLATEPASPVLSNPEATGIENKGDADDTHETSVARDAVRHDKEAAAIAHREALGGVELAVGFICSN